MQFIKEFEDIDISDLSDYLLKCSQPFAASELYDSIEAAKFIDLSKRLSEFRAIVDPELFKISEKILKKLEEKDEYNSYLLVNNDITHIKYQPGGFFKSHRDYLSITSNIIEEYTLLICVTPEEISKITKGGETLIHVSPYYTHVSKTTITTGSGILFRKDLLHEGSIILSGGKEIISMNILVIRKNTLNDGILFVTFPSSEKNSLIDTMQNKSYALSVSNINKVPQSLLAGLVNFQNKSDNIYKYECENISYEDFAIIANVVNGVYISANEAIRNMDLLDYYGYDKKNLLINFNDEDIPELENYDDDENIIEEPKLGLGGETCYLCNKIDNKLYDCSKCHKVKYCSKKCQKIHWQQIHKIECGKVDLEKNEQIIICQNAEKTKVFSKLAAELEQPMITFKIIFAEGTISFGGGMSGTNPVMVKMQPVYVTLGDYENILLKINLMTTHPNIDEPENILDLMLDDNEDNDEDDENDDEKFKHNQSVKLVDEYYESEEDSDDEKGENKKIMRIERCENINFGLLFSKPENMKELIKSTLGIDSKGYPSLLYKDYISLPSNGKTLCSYKYFHIDENNKTCFTKDEAETMCEYLEEIKFLDYVKRQINKIEFQLPQIFKSNDRFFCNESVYGSFNFLEVTGMLMIPRD